MALATESVVIKNTVNSTLSFILCGVVGRAEKTSTYKVLYCKLPTTATTSFCTCVQAYINYKKTSFVTAKEPASHQRDFLHKLRVLLFFTEFNILIFIMICRTQHHSPSQPLGEEVSHQTPGPCPGYQTPSRINTH